MPHQRTRLLVLWYNNHRSLSAPQLQKVALLDIFFIGI
jgi:hypothetical protein